VSESDLATLLVRLASAHAGARRVAAIELSRMADSEPAARGLIARAAVGRLAHERDEKAALTLVRILARHAREAGIAPQAARALEAPYDDPAAPVVPAVEAIRAAGSLLDPP